MGVADLNGDIRAEATSDSERIPTPIRIVDSAGKQIGWWAVRISWSGSETMKYANYDFRDAVREYQSFAPRPGADSGFGQLCSAR